MLVKMVKVYASWGILGGALPPPLPQWSHALLVLMHQWGLASLHKTVGSMKGRYRLDHWWVPEMVLNVQSIYFLYFEMLG